MDNVNKHNANRKVINRVSSKCEQGWFIFIMCSLLKFKAHRSHTSSGFNGSVQVHPLWVVMNFAILKLQSTSVKSWSVCQFKYFVLFLLLKPKIMIFKYCRFQDEWCQRWRLAQRYTYKAILKNPRQMMLFVQIQGEMVTTLLCVRG